MKSFEIILILFLATCFAQTAFAQKTFKLGFVKEHDFSGDRIWLASTKKKERIDSKAIAIFSYNSLGTININGRDIDLKLDRGDLPDKNFKIGRGGYEIWKGENITVRFDYVFTWLCPPKNEQCEVYYYKGILNINYSGKRRKFNVVGFGGT